MATKYPVQVTVEEDGKSPLKLWLFRVGASGPVKRRYVLRIGSSPTSKVVYHTTDSTKTEWVRTEDQAPAHLWLARPTTELSALVRRLLFPVTRSSIGPREYPLSMLNAPWTGVRLWLRRLSPDSKAWGLFLYSGDGDGSPIYSWLPGRGWLSDPSGEAVATRVRVQDSSALPPDLRNEMFPLVLTDTEAIGQLPKGKFAINHEAFYLTVNHGHLTGRTYHFSLNGNGPGSFTAKDGDRYARLTDHRYRCEGVGSDIVLTDFDGTVCHYNRTHVSIDTEKPGGMKYSVGKRRFGLFPLGVMREILGVLEYGAKKYGVENWKVVPDARTEYFNAVHRHLDDWQNGELRDRETGFLHMAHLLCDAAFLCWFDLNPEFKIVPKTPISK